MKSGHQQSAHSLIIVSRMQRTRLADDTNEVEEPSTYVGDDTGMARANALQPPPKGAPADDRKIWLDHQLDTMVGKTLLRQFVLLGPHQRRYGGTFCVLTSLPAHA